MLYSEYTFCSFKKLFYKASRRVQRGRTSPELPRTAEIEIKGARSHAVRGATLVAVFLGPVLRVLHKKGLGGFSLLIGPLCANNLYSTVFGIH